jgi:hypothetical protein
VRRAISRSPELGQAGRLALSSPVLGGLIALLTWPIATPIPRAGTDASWVAGLYIGLRDGLQFGTEFVFAYGPLGFLEQPALYDSGLWIVALLFRTLIYVALAAALLWATRRALPLPLAAAAVYALLAIGYLEAAAVLLTFVVCVAAVSDDPPRGTPYLIAIGGGVLAAIELLGKLNFGIAIAGLCLIALLGLPGRRRNVSLFSAVFLVSLAALWLIAGQSIDHLPDFASNSLQVLSGYSEAMPVNVSDAGWQRPWALASVVLLIGAAVLAGLREPRSRRLSLFGLAALFGFLVFKQSFVRQGLGNASDFFPLMLGAALALSWRLPTKIPRLPPHAVLLALLAPLAVLTVAAFPGPSFLAALKPSDHVEYLRQDVKALIGPSERRELARQGAEAMRSSYRLDTASRRWLSSREVAVEPLEIGAAWAYDLDWHPLPVIQGYQAYTPDLDQLDVQALEGPGRPTAILRQNPAAFEGSPDTSIDNRNISWDPPAAARAMLCNYRAVRTTRRWQVLYPTADRCGQVRHLGHLQTETGRPIRVPSPPGGTFVFARIHGLGVSGLEQLRTFLYRARQRTATVNGTHTWRVVPGTAADGLILAAAPGVDFPPPFALAPRAQTLNLQVAGDPGRHVEIDFYAQAIAPERGRHRLSHSLLDREPGGRGSPQSPRAAGRR